MPNDLENYTPAEPKNDAKEALQDLHRKVGEASEEYPYTSQEKKVKAKIEEVLNGGGYLVEHKEGGKVLNARDLEEAERMVNDLADHFEHELKQHPELFDDLPKPTVFSTSYPFMFMWATERGLAYNFKVDVMVKGDNVMVVASGCGVG